MPTVEMPLDFEKKMQRRIANVAIGASTVRGNPKGTKKRIRDHLAHFDFSELKNGPNDDFAIKLDEWTKIIRETVLLPGAQHWGVARKCLNIFLRDATYNYLLREKYKLEAIRKFLEVPLDNIVAARLKEAESDLSRFPGIIHLESKISKDYQDAAERIAAKKGLEARVDLDLYYWN